jgi:mannosyl-oligosaccharide alpha-1,2-mannosidase
VNLPSRPSHEKAPSSSVNDWIHRADLVKQSFIFAWNGYVEHAFGFDEVAPVTNQSVLNLNGWGVTIVDSLSTMQLMGLHTEYKKAMKHVRRLKFRDYVCSYCSDLVTSLSIHFT